MDAIVTWVMSSGYGQYIVCAIAIANAITAVLPSSIKGNAAYNVVMKMMNFVSMNIGANANKDDQTLAQSLK